MQRLTTVLLAALTALAISGSAVALASDAAPPAPAVTVSGAASALRAFAADLDGGGRADWSGISIGGSVKRQFVPAFAAGLSLAYDRQEWNFDTASKFGSAAPWGVLQRSGVGLNLSLALSKSVLVGVSPSAEWASARGVSGNDALTYGATFSALKVFSPRFVLGGGAKAYRQFYNVKVSPFVILNWRLTDQWRIANSISAGPLGGAGIELRLAPDERWEFACGGVMRSDRFRLGDGGAYAGDIAEPGCIPILARASRTFDTKTRIDLYAGALFAGTLKVKDMDGKEIVKDTFAPAPAIALTLSHKF
jgi:hypothetical protein